MNLSENLSLSEMIRSESAKRNGISNQPTAEHIENMKVLAQHIFQPIREHFGKPIHVSSGYRSKDLNKAIGGSQTSQHSRGQAIDIDMDGSEISNRDVFMFIKDNLEFDQLIWEFGTKGNPDWVHVSYNTNGNQRKQVLIAKKYAGKTIYLNF
jgi:hypothetical protein